MALVLTSNIIITRDLDLMSEIFSKEVISIDDKKSEAFLISNSFNKYLVSFEYENNMSNSENKQLTLSFADTDGGFEEFYINDNKIFDSTLASLISNKEFSSINVSSNDVFKTDYIYVSFGNGNQRKNWSAPQLFILNHSTINIVNGMRMFSFSYLPQNTTVLSTRPIYYNTNKINPQELYLHSKDTDAGLNYSIRTKSSEYFTNILREYLKGYVSKLSASVNVVVLLPDIDALLESYVAANKGVYSSKLDCFQKLFFFDISHPQKSTSLYEQISFLDGNVAGRHDQQVESDVASNEDKKTFIVKFNNEKFSKNDVQNQALPFNVYNPINSINLALGKLMGSDFPGGFKVVFENNLEYLRMFKSVGLTKDMSQAIFVGFLVQIKEYVYRIGCPILDKSVDPASDKTFNPTINLARVGGSAGAGRSSEDPIYRILNSPTYLQNLNSVISIRKNSSAFSEQIILDELGYDFQKAKSNRGADPVISNILKSVKQMQNSDWPIFMHNFKNSNVISINVSQNSFLYINALNLAITEDNINKFVLKCADKYKESEVFKRTNLEIEDMASKVKNIIIKSKNNDMQGVLSELSRDTKATEEYLKYIGFNNQDFQDTEKVTKLIIDFSLMGNSPPEINKYTNLTKLLNEKFQLNHAEEIKVLSFIINRLYSDNNSIIKLKSYYGGNSEQYRRGKIFNELHISSNKDIIIKTLPYFNLSDQVQTLNKKAMLLSKKIIAVISPRSKDLEFSQNSFDFFSGVYTITGFRHVINQNECYSEFRLNKFASDSLF